MSPNQTENSYPTTTQGWFDFLKPEILADNRPEYVEYLVTSPLDSHQLCKRLGLDPQIESKKGWRLCYNSLHKFLSITRSGKNVHSIPFSWASREIHCSARGFFTPEEADDLYFLVRSGYDRFVQPYQGSFKQPGLSIRVPGAKMPSIIFEYGLDKLYGQLLREKELWLEGSSVHVVMIFKWSLVSANQVKGFVEVWRQDSTSTPDEHIEIFPRPPPDTQPQTIRLFRRDFYPNGVVPQGRSPDDIIPLNVDRLRKTADTLIREDGNQPAVEIDQLRYGCGYD